MVSPELIETLDKLPPALQSEILNYAKYLATQYIQPSNPDQTPKTYRQAGTMKGMFTLADDFDEPLEDLKDYM
jgi:Protein of unknown function (DUF2281)